METKKKQKAKMKNKKQKQKTKSKNEKQKNKMKNDKQDLPYMEKVSSSLVGLAEKSRRKGLNLEFHLGGNLKIQLRWRKTFHFFHVCC